MKFDRKSLLLYSVTDRSWTGKSTLYEQVEMALKGGVTCVQLREKKLPYQEFLNEAYEICRLCNSYNVPFIVNDNTEIALECGADGVHVGQSDMSVFDIRQKAGRDFWVGVSVQTAEQAVTAEKCGADYLGAGAVFVTSTKRDVADLSLETLKDICSAASIPVVAIGGITRSNIEILKGTGVMGAAVVSAIFSAPDIEAEAGRLLECSKRMVNCNG